MSGSVARRLMYHSAIVGNIACQKAFTAFHSYWDNVPGMGVIRGLLQRAVAGPQIIHGLMWNVWHVVGGCWLIEKEDGAGAAYVFVEAYVKMIQVIIIV